MDQDEGQRFDVLGYPSSLMVGNWRSRLWPKTDLKDTRWGVKEDGSPKRRFVKTLVYTCESVAKNPNRARLIGGVSSGYSPRRGEQMTTRSDPENNEIRALLDLADFSGKNVLEIGCGDGRLTGRYANVAASVTAIDPFEPGIQRAKENVPDKMRDRVEFNPIAFEDFASTCESAMFDIVILSWALC
ncbi:MAG: class I SAM-dependent methyltransferase [Anaerolineales bacterium]|nr:MAG: class I SAM-dependent methyltransferase [Anaerolineales bacterium]